MTYKEKKHLVNKSLKELFPEYDFYVDRDMLDVVFQLTCEEAKELEAKDEL